MPSDLKYELVIYWSKEDDCYVVVVPELPGCMADGKTYDQAVREAQVAMQLWVDTARDLGREVPEPKGRLMYA